MIELKVTGVKELQQTFKELSLDFNRTVAGALVAGCFVISNDAKDRCRYLTGNARRSIHIGYEGSNVTTIQATDNAPQPVAPGIVVRIAGDLEKNGRVELLVGTDVWYTWQLEFVHGFPFLRPALDENRQEVHAEIRRALQQVIRKATK
jgi:hypothetical protein